ncbi:capsid assembly protein [uncultured Mediterranean phage uvMED]|nr:capsid assembly protein [uncultured Mediterranean phage uvMED]
MDNQTTEQQVQSDPIVDTTTDQSQTSVLAEEQTTQTNFQDLIPDEYRAEKSLENFKDMGDFVKSYLSAQKIVGADKIPVPNKFATEDDWKAVFNKLGAPEKPEDYKYSFKDGEVDKELISSFNQEAHRLGLLPQQAESLIKYYKDMNEGSSIQAEEKATETRLHTENELKREFGPQYTKRLDQAKRLASSTLGSEFLNNTFLQDGSRLGDNIAVVKAFSELADKLSEDEVVKGDTSGYMTAKDLEKEISTLQEEGSPFWDKQHPNHERTVQEVFKLRQLLHNG